MKNFYCLFLSLLILTAPVFADVTQTGNVIEINSEMLKSKFDGYELTFKNNGKNPVKVTNIEVKNFINNSNQVLVSDALQGIKKNNKYIYLDIFTFGISGFVGNAKNNKILTKQKEALAEAATFSSSLESLKGEIILPQKDKTIKVFVPIGEQPIVEGVFQDTKTNEYMSLKVAK